MIRLINMIRYHLTYFRPRLMQYGNRNYQSSITSGYHLIGIPVLYYLFSSYYNQPTIDKSFEIDYNSFPYKMDGSLNENN
jgi:hypothetical protein